MRTLMLLLLAATVCVAQQKESRFESVFENNTVNVDSVELPPGFHAPIFQNTHDVIWIALTPGALAFKPDQGAAQEVSFHAGDTRLFRSFQARSVANTSGAAVRAVVVELKPRGLISPGCFCSSAVERAVCGCGGAESLPELWAVGIGSLMLSGSTMTPGQGYQRGMRRNDMLLIAVSAANLRDDVADQSFDLKAGDVRWIAAGTHQLRNAGESPAKLVTIEF